MNVVDSSGPYSKRILGVSRPIIFSLQGSKLNQVVTMETVMESSGQRSQGGILSWSMSNYPPRSRPNSVILQGMLMFVIFTTHFHGAVSKRNESLTVPAPTLGPWNKTLYKIERQCLDFRSASSPSYFYYWPEDDFDYCCCTITAQDKLRFSYGGNLSFTYGLHGPRLAYETYYDLGPIDQCLPYWKFGCLLPKLYESVLFNFACEFKDLMHLYNWRFWIGIVLNYGLLQSALPLILSLEILVIPFVVLYWVIWGRRPGHKLLKQVFTFMTVKDWFRATRKTLLIDWIHLSLLAIIGNGLLEAMGHQNPQTAAAQSFYQYSLLYIALTFLVWISSLLQQLSFWVSEIEDHCEYDVLPTHEASRSGCSSSSQERTHLSRQSSEATKLKERIGLDADWKLQPIGAQAGILFCLWAFLTNVGGDGSALFGIVVAAAAPWSGLYALRVIGTCIYFLVKLRLSIAEKRCRHRQRIRGLWRRVIHLEKWRGARGNGYEAELNNSAQPDINLLLHEGEDRVK